jgi:uncharacterized lipoprotein YmbA
MTATRPRYAVRTCLPIHRSATRWPTRLIAAALLGASCASLISGCASAPPTRVLLALPTGAVPANATTPARSGPMLAVRRVSVPEYLETRRVRYRADDTTLAEWPNTFWAERFEISVTRELVAALRRGLPGWSVCEATCPDQPPNLNLQAELAPLDFMRASQRLQLRARITLSGAASTIPQTRDFAFEIPSAADTPHAHAQAVTEALRALAQELVPIVQGAPGAQGTQR